MADQQYCLRWNNHQNTLISVFDSLQERGCMVDCTLGAEGQSLQAHKVVLSACSPYLEDLLTKHYDKHPILILKDVRFEELKAMVDYMYRGEVNVAHDKLNTFLRAAESLQIKGLSDSGHDPPDTGGTSSGTKRTSKGAPVSVRSSQQLTVRSTNLADESRDGSVSPSQRKRRRRRGSEESENDSSSNVADGKQSSAAVAPVTGPSVLNQDLLPSVPASGPADALLSSIMESAETETATDSGIFANAVTPSSQENVIQDKGSSDLLIEPKTEYLDDDTQDMPLGDDDSGAGPSHSRSGNFMNDSDMFMPDQDGTNAQDVKVLREVAFKIDEDDVDTKANVAVGGDALPVIASVGFVKDEVHDPSDVVVKQEPGLEDEDDDRAHDEAFADKMDVEPAQDEGHDDAVDDVMLMDEGADHADGEDQVRRSKRQFFCKQCPAHFNRPQHLKKHEQVHGANKAFACPHCNASFVSETRLNQHVVVHSDDARDVFRCSKCDETFSSAHLLKEHMPTHSWRCPYCSNVFGTLHGLKIHVRTHNKTLPTFGCSECPATVTTKEELRAHKRAKHPTAPPPPPPPGLQDSQWDCQKCERKYDTLAEMLEHAKIHADKRFPCKDCAAQYDTKLQLVNHIVAEHPEEINCTKCDLTFLSMTDLDQHMLTHDDQDKHLRCELCPKVFATNYHLLQHMDTHDQKLECDVCEAKFLNRSLLELHEKTHTEGAYRCDDCGKRFQQKAQLTQHMKIHDAQKPHGCEECFMRFKTEPQLAKHMRSHRRTGAFNCSDCGAPFMNSTQLQEHVRTHHIKKVKSYWCEECTESFPTKALLEQHVRSHPDRALFQCEHCSLQFATDYGLQQHMRTHSDLRPYLCGYCGQSFTLKDHLIRHMKVHKKK